MPPVQSSKKIVIFCLGDPYREDMENRYWTPVFNALRIQQIYLIGDFEDFKLSS